MLLPTCPQSPATLVLGGSGAIGAALVNAVKRRGDFVVSIDRNLCTDADLTQFEADITKPEDVKLAFAKLDALLAERQRDLTNLIIASGILRPSGFLRLTDKDLSEHLDVNVIGAFRVAQAAAQRMRSHGGRIVCITSIHGQVAVRDRAAYAMSKAAVAAMVRAMSAELSEFGIRVNALAPGAVEAGMRPNAQTGQAWRNETPSGRIASLEEIVDFTLLLISDQASFLSGQTIALDGGVSTSRVL